MPKEPKIIFHHIPKCGGTSLVTGLVMTYYPLRLLRYAKAGFSGNLHAPASTLAAEENSTDRFAFRRALLSYQVYTQRTPFIAGHYPFNNTLYNKIHTEWRFITLLRDPVERWYSEYFWNRYKNHDYHQTDQDIESYLDSDQGKETAWSFTNYFSERDHILFPPTSDQILQSLDHLQKMTVVGLLEELGQFQTSMQKTFGRKPFLPKRNQTPATQEERLRPDPDSAFHKKLLQILEPEIEIYQKTKEHLKRI